MKNIILFLLFPTLVPILGCSLQQPTKSPEIASTPLEPTHDAAEPQKGMPRIKLNTSYTGQVSKLGMSWLELNASWQGENSLNTNKTPKRLSAVGTKPGGDPEGSGLNRGYRLADLKVGDVIWVDTGVAADGTEFTLHILLFRRPGGKIPPSPYDPFPEIGSHLSYQAHQDWEERGIPIPKEYLDQDGRATRTKPPYPPVAPHPRDKTQLDPVVTP